MNTNLPFSQACENNKDPILERLQDVFNEPGMVLEVGTGTGQHAVHFAQALPHLQWQPTEHPSAAHLAPARLKLAGLSNILPMLELDVGQPVWPIDSFQWAFSANTAHIMAWSEVEKMFYGIGERLSEGGAFCLYGPFNHHGEFTSQSNREFDRHLKARAAHMGIRDRDDLAALAEAAKLTLTDHYPMPANNGMLVFQKSTETS